MEFHRSPILWGVLLLISAPVVLILYQSLTAPSAVYVVPEEGHAAYIASLEHQVDDLRRRLEEEREARKRAEFQLRQQNKSTPAPEPAPEAPRAEPSPTNRAYRHTLSSGLFSIPADAKSVDWAVINNSDEEQAIRVTVFEVGVKVPKKVASPGSLTMTVAPFESTHNANSVGPDKPFQRGFYYEIVVETNSSKLLPSVSVWSDHGNAGIPGTMIGPGAFVDMADGR